MDQSQVIPETDDQIPVTSEMDELPKKQARSTPQSRAKRAAAFRSNRRLSVTADRGSWSVEDGFPGMRGSLGVLTSGGDASGKVKMILSRHKQGKRTNSLLCADRCLLHPNHIKNVTT